ncbi:MAG: ankyrin repeat domain-containing protein [Candidatus Micrarchaeaceae archaeon]
MEIISYDCLKQILLFSHHLDLIKWRLVSKTFKNIIDNLSIQEVNIYEAFKRGYYLNIKKYNKIYNYNYAIQKAIEGKNFNLIKILLKAKLPIDITKCACLLIEYQNTDIAKYLIDNHKLNLDIVIESAAFNNNIYLIDYLLNLNASIDSAIVGSCKSKNIRLTKYLLSINKQNKITDKIKDAFKFSCENGEINIIKLFLNKYKNLDPWCGLLTACKNGHIEIVKFIFNNFNIDFDDQLFFNACESGKLELYKYLKSKFSNFLINPLDCFILACKSGNIEIVKYFEDKVYNIEYGFYTAISYGHIEVVKYLLNSPKLVMNNYHNINEIIYNPDIEIFKLISNIVPDNFFNNFELYVDKDTKFEVVKTFIDKGINIDNALITAASNNRFDIVKYLINNVKNTSTLNMALIMASYNPEGLEMVKYLINHGANSLFQSFITAYKNYNLDIADYLSCIDIEIKNIFDK